MGIKTTEDLLLLAHVLEVLVESHRSLSSNERAYSDSTGRDVSLDIVDKLVKRMKEDYQ